jgi:signal transduction histidine kinase
VHSVLRVFQAQLQAKNPIAVHTELAATLPKISADPDLLHRALSNLVLNAIDAMPQGGKLTIGSKVIGGRVEISVSDTGSGLTPEECERLFTPYYTTKQHGTGLGLAIVQSVVSDHGGKISVESAKNKGTTFRIELPRDAHPS